MKFGVFGGRAGKGRGGVPAGEERAQGRLRQGSPSHGAGGAGSPPPVPSPDLPEAPRGARGDLAQAM